MAAGTKMAAGPGGIETSIFNSEYDDKDIPSPYPQGMEVKAQATALALPVPLIGSVSSPGSLFEPSISPYYLYRNFLLLFSTLLITVSSKS